VTLPADEPRSPLDIPDYRRFWLARFLSVFATTGMVVVLGYQLYDVARSQCGMSLGTAAFQLGLLGLAQFLPVLLLTPLAGLIADRYDRRIVAGSAVGIDMVVALVLMLATIARASRSAAAFRAWRTPRDSARHSSARRWPRSRRMSFRCG
jgi:MFS family permease